MSIKKRLLLSNIGMIIVPVIGFFIVEVILGYFFFVVFNGSPQEDDLRWFISLRFLAIAAILIITNGVLTYFVSKSILTPIRELSAAAQKISDGDLDFPIKAARSDELGELASTFNTMRLNLKEAKEAQARYEQNRKELIAIISHDLKTPLTSIKGYVKGVQDGVANTPEKKERYMETIYQKANEVDGLIDELFLFSKLDLERIPFRFEEVDLRAFMTDIIDELNFHSDSGSGREFASLFTEQEKTYVVEADREQLKRVVTNIIQNSLKYMDQTAKKVDIYLQSGLEYVEVKIKDNGKGIAEQDLPYLFERFYRTDASRNSATGGSGLGLAIVKKIIEQHGGTVWAESEQGKSTSIHFTLKKVA